MAYDRSPLKIVVTQPDNKGLVKVIHHSAYVYRRSNVTTDKPKPYWTPNGVYFIRYGKLSFPVTFERNKFVLRIDVINFLVMLAILKDNKHHVASREPSSELFAEEGA